MENRKENFEKFQNTMVLKNHITIVVITLQEHLRESKKKMKKHCELDDDKEPYEYQRKRDISISKEKQIRSNKFILQKSQGSIKEEAFSTLKKC